MTKNTLSEKPGEEYLAIRTVARPLDTNPNGDIFGGWIVSQMDIGAAIVAAVNAQGRVVTVAIDKLVFHKPVFVGDEVSVYCQLIKIGRTSLTIKVETWVRRSLNYTTLKVTEGIFTFVAIDEHYKSRPISTPSTY